MADDGMLLNFELPSDAFASTKSFKGGNWKDRLTAKKSYQYGKKKAQERAATGRGSIPNFQEVRNQDEELIHPDSRPAKRPRTGNPGEVKTAHRSSSGNARPAGGAPQHGTSNASKNGVISSLFTYSPSTSKVEANAPAPPADDKEDVQPSNAPLSDELANFTSLGLSAPLASHLLRKLDIKAPTAIQRKAIEQLCSTHADAFIQAETGSGKTLAYLLPIVQRLMQLSKQMKAAGNDLNRESGLFAIVLSPTRELSKQISAVLESLLACCHWIVSGTVIGGEKKKSEKARLRKGLNILVATPGRLADHIDNTEVLDVSTVRWLVLDEGDRLMELGFEKDIQKIIGVLNLRRRKTLDASLSDLPERRCTVLCSATLKEGVEQLKHTTLKDASSIAVETDGTNGSQTEQKETTFSAPAQLRQSYVLVPPKQRLVTLVATLRQSFKRKGSVAKCVVFMSCADSVDFHFDLLTQESFGASKSVNEEIHEEASRTKPAKLTHSNKIAQGNSISEARTQGPATAFSSTQNPVQLFRLHGSLQQSTRTSTLLAFTKCTDASVLVCTDVASRGLDLPNIDLVIEYDPPFSKDDHLHRVGRTARAGREGRAMIFLAPGCEEGYVDVLKNSGPRQITRHDADEMLKKGFSPSAGVVREGDWQQAATDWQLDVERWALEHPKHLEQARRAFQSHVRAYATHVAAERSIFDMGQLHLGHLAKAFALRDKPGSIRVPGQRPGKDEGRKTNDARKASAARSSGATKRGRQDDDAEDPSANDEREARKRMHMKMKAMGGASEFNLG
ncbi:ATP-dependent RNA helicase dbp7 [Saxophila tyrrhenica]|uniref:ATP-dependent RNA helicase n=1 Tax=Saxophila tyrrhenica TaxID=1690608 RepID=A0AAV9P2D1_9PEZI|nr:ATP-dependent RNA helicase dbp7 [Saxophila tyrrhenica]